MPLFRDTGPLVAALSFLGIFAVTGCEGTISGGPAGSANPPASGSGPGSGAAASGGSTSGGTGTGGAVGEVSGEFSRLTRVEYARTIREALSFDVDLSGTPVDGRVGPFTSNGSVSMDPVHPYLLTAEEVAEALVPSELPACEVGAVAECVARSYRGPLERLYRRPLSDAELSTATSMIEGLQAAGGPAVEATRALLVFALISPDFLFRTSPLAADTQARARRLAEHLSYALWDAPPDAALAATASDASVELGEALGRQARRLSTDSRATPALARFIAQWLHVDTDLRLENAEFATSPRFLELLAYVEDALANEVPVTSLVSGERGFVHQDNLDAYGLNSVDGAVDRVASITWPVESGRRGVLGQDLFADATRHPDPGRRPIFRGLLVRRSLLCQAIPAPSADLVALAGEVGDRTTDPRCAGCHLRLDPIGKAFATLDPNDTAGAVAAELSDHPELAGSYADLPALLGAVAESRAFAECFARHWLAFFLEQELDDADAAWVSQLADGIQAGASLGAVVEQTVMTLATRSETAEPWCKSP